MPLYRIIRRRVVEQEIEVCANTAACAMAVARANESDALGDERDVREPTFRHTRKED